MIHFQMVITITSHKDKGVIAFVFTESDVGTHPLRHRLLKLVIEETFVHSSLPSKSLKITTKQMHEKINSTEIRFII